MNRRVGLLLFLVCLAANVAASVRPTPTAAVERGTLELQIVPGPLERLGVTLIGDTDDRGSAWFMLTGADGLLFDLADHAPTAVRAGQLSIVGLQLRRADGATSPPLALAPGDDPQSLNFTLRDADGGVWLRLMHAMRSPDARADGLRVFTSDLRVGPALAAWSGHPDLEGALFAGASLRAPLRRMSEYRLASAKSCALPNWPGRSGYVTDVQLTSIDSIDTLRCQRHGGGSCDGPGGVDDEFVVVPSTTLRNSDAANATDVPWYTRLSGVFPPYANDQHPYLIWNLYRIDADGRLEQIARSGLKHAFATENLGCSEPCGNSHILGRGCSDRYNAFSNDASSLLAPRAEVVPAHGLWGRCGSVMDRDCDGVLDAIALDAWRERMVVDERSVDPDIHADARWFIDAWYVVRDDENIRNTMGFRPAAFGYVNGSWRATSVASYRSGSVLDLWMEEGPGVSRAMRTDLSPAEGQLSVAVRVTRQAAARYRYAYIVMNFEFARASVSGVAPDLVVDDNRGFDRISVPVVGGGVLASGFSDGDIDGGNDWNAAVDGTTLHWIAPAGNSLDWGSLFSFTLVSRAPPTPGTLQLRVAAGGAPADFGAATLVPDPGWIYADGFD